MKHKEKIKIGNCVDSVFSLINYLKRFTSRGFVKGRDSFSDNRRIADQLKVFIKANFFTWQVFEFRYVLQENQKNDKLCLLNTVFFAIFKTIKKD